MAAEKITRSLAADFGGSVNLRTLAQEISDNPNITTALEHGNHIDLGHGDPDNVDIWFVSTPSAGELTELDAVVIPAHNPTLSSVKILRYVPSPASFDPYVAPVDLDYKTGLTRRLHQKITFVLGDDAEVDYYDSYDPDTDTFSDLILKVRTTYDYSGVIPLGRTKTRTWVREDETDAEPAKVSEKFYRGNERTAVIARRAANARAMQNTIGLGLIIEDQMTNLGKTQAEAYAIGLGYADEWYIFFENEIRQFEATNSRSYWDAIQALTAPDLQWAHDTPGFLAAVAAEVNLDNWT